MAVTIGMKDILASGRIRRYRFDAVFQPALFRIPKVSAEIHFAIEKMSEKGFNVLVYGSTEAHRREQQHKVSFDIVAAPPPPDMNQRLQKIDIGGLLLMDPVSRQNAKKQLESFFEKNAAAIPQGKEFLMKRIPDFIKKFQHVLILRAEQVWALILPVKTKEQVYNLDVIYLLLAAEHPEVTDDIKSDGTRQTLTRLIRLNRLSEILYKLSDRQQRLLAELEPKNA